MADRGTRVPVAATTMAALKQELSVRGVMAMTVENRIHVVPPCVVTADDMTQGMVALDGALAAVAA